MNIIFDTRVLTHKTYTGVENYTDSLLKYLKKKLKLNIVKPKSDNKYLAHIWNHFILAFKQGDILFCPANIAPLYVPQSKKLIVTIHDVAFLTQPDSFSNLFKNYYKYLMPFVIKRADKIITISEFSKNEILKYYPYAREKIEIIPLGISDRFKVIDSTLKEKVILYVGSLNKRKNFMGVIKAFEMLNRDDYKLQIVGDFSENFTIDDKIKQILLSAKNNKNIEFKRNVSGDELVHIYNNASIFIFPSFYEGFGLPPLEAMACGTPVITSNITSLPEVCADAVIYCDPYSNEDIKNKLESLLDNPNLQNNMIEKGLKHVKSFTWDKSAQKHINLFKKVFES